MAKTSAIANAILRLGPGEFQEFCDEFLSKQEKYGAILGLGKKSGTAKTTIGNPDTYFRKDNGKYVFAVYTTGQKDINSKIRTDIEKCFDEKKTGLPMKEIEEIICCHTSSTLKPGDDLKLHQMCKNKGIKLLLIGVDELAHQVNDHMPILARDYLHIPVSTNQIMSIDEFVDEYDSNELAAPLDTIFNGRDEDLCAIEKCINDYKVVIVHGPSGVGKTRLVLESVKRYVRSGVWTALCIKNNNQPIYDDLIDAIDKTGNYLVFVDDANTLAELSTVVGFINRCESRCEVKVILTVRDYAKAEVLRSIRDQINPYLFEVMPFSDQEIVNFLNVNMGICNSFFTDQIVKIAEGKPRIAYMAGKIAKDTNSISSVHDASQVYEQYYASLIDGSIGQDRRLCLTAGILAAVNAVYISNLKPLDTLLEFWGITEADFINDIHTLSRMEVVRIHKDLIAAVEDQCFANYLLYYVFIIRKEIPFSEMLVVGFKHFRKGIMQSFNTLLNLFYNNELREYLNEEVKKAWARLETEKDFYFDEFAKVFHLFNPEAAFVLTNEKIDNLANEPISETGIDFLEKAHISNSEGILDFLSGYEYYRENLRISIGLLLKYVGKSDQAARNGLSFIQREYSINQDSYRNDYLSISEICSCLKDYQNPDMRIKQFNLAVAEYYLNFEFSSAKSGRGNTVQLYQVNLSDSAGVRAYRNICWNIISSYASTVELQTSIEEMLMRYALSIRTSSDSSIVLEDKGMVESILSVMNATAFRKALICQELIRGWEKHNIDGAIDDAVIRTPEWKAYMTVGNTRPYIGIAFDEYERQKEKELVEFAKEISIDAIPVFIKTTAAVYKESFFKYSKEQNYDIVRNLQIISREVAQDAKKAEAMLKALGDFSANMDVYPGDLISALFEAKTAQGVWETIHATHMPEMNTWEYTFFERLPNRMVDEYTYSLLLHYLNDPSEQNITSTRYRDIHFWDKFLVINQDIYVEASKIILHKVENNSLLFCRYFSLMFNELCFSPDYLIRMYRSDLDLLRTIYFIAMKGKELNDYHGIFLSAFLSLGDEWINDYALLFAETLVESAEYEHEQFAVLWKLERYVYYFDHIFDKVCEIYDPIYDWRLAQAFSVLLSHNQDDYEIMQRQEAWIEHVVTDYAQNEKIKVVFAALSEMDSKTRMSALSAFLRKNEDYEVFINLTFESPIWGGIEEEIIPQLKARIEYFESVLQLVQGASLLKHAQFIRGKIDALKNQIKSEELDIIYRKLY